MTENTRARVRRPTLLATGIAAGAALALGAPLAASAHVHVDPGTAAAGTTSTLTFAFSHGCEGAATTALVVEIPDAAANATPIVAGGWSVDRELGDDGVPTTVTYTADTPVEDGLKATVSMDVLFEEDAADTTVAFPIVQQCEEGENAWVEIAEEGEDAHELDSPAPVVAVGAVAAEDDHGHADAADEEAEAAGDAHADAAGTTADASSVSGGDPVARWLAGAGLAAGLAALIVVIVRGRPRRS
ncbi:DUF1775 domain-containing protein [Microbacterium hominis]|uniref:DUF1775 domain-containing protein n=1 Tax=Microbacterium hominis TaxID=162426 RepID=A0A7D4PMV7_9MICO|nr:DUF1775 domain-containing protein [Microbacterium hominis]QKJ19875.1 DUF1775 domain-containing protein [Microbacterium hominis]